MVRQKAMNKEAAQKRPVIYLAGDSTAQSYGERQRPQSGWGEELLRALDPVNSIVVGHRESSPFEQETFYENCRLIVDNCAMAGRSSKTFREEGRLSDIADHISAGDYLLIQFGHNDAAKRKKDRYVALEDFGAALKPYLEAAKKAGAHPVLLSSISLRPCRENEMGAAGEIKRALPLYAKAMEYAGRKEGIPYIDMGKMTRQACESAKEETTRRWYREDQIHLVKEGAEIFAAILAKELKPLLDI